MFAFGFDINVVNRCTLIATIGYVSFIFGRNIRIVDNSKRVRLPKTNPNSLFPTAMCIMCMVLDFYKIYILRMSDFLPNSIAETGAWKYFDVIKHSVFVASILVQFITYFEKKEQIRLLLKRHWALWMVIIIDCLFVFASGSRTEPISIILIMIAGLTLFVEISLTKTIVGVLVGIIFMSIIQLYRSSNLGNFSLNILDTGMDLIINNYTLYYAYSIVNKQGHIIFPLIGPLLRGIPLLLGFVVRFFSIPEYYSTSASFFTYHVLSGRRGLGIGTNILASLYLSTGIYGVIIGMFLLGAFGKYLVSNKTNKGILAFVFYFELMGDSVYLVRSEFFNTVGKTIMTSICLLLFMKITIKIKE